MAKSEAEILAEVMDKTRQLTKYYVSKLKEVDPYTRVEFGGEKFNSVYWLTAHLLWAENYLIVTMTGGKSLAPEWSNHYAIGADGSLHEGHGTYKELLDELKAVHEKAMNYLTTLTDEHLAKDNTAKFNFGDGDCSNRFVIQHAIRHESMHTGNLGWIAKISKKHTV